MQQKRAKLQYTSDKLFIIRPFKVIYNTRCIAFNPLLLTFYKNHMGRYLETCEDLVHEIQRKHCDIFVVKEYFYIFHGYNILYKCKTDGELRDYLSRIERDKYIYNKRRKRADKRLERLRIRNRQRKIDANKVK